MTNVATVATGMRVQIVHRADAQFPFLHDTVIAPLNGRLFMAWYNCTEHEISGRTVIRGRWSADSGESWSEAEIVAEDALNGRHMVPAIFSVFKAEVWAYVTEMSAHDRPTGYVCLRLENGRWQARERRDDLVVFNTLPQRLPSGRWIVGGRMSVRAGARPEVPIVAMAAPGAPARWALTHLPGPWAQGQFPLSHPEVALLVNGREIDAFVRNDAGDAQVCTSRDGGQSWSALEDCGLPIAPAKMYGGNLPDGRQYLLFNQRTPVGDRSRLLLALRAENGGRFGPVYVLADGFDETLDAGPCWHYPCACVSGGCLHISCTVSDEHDSARRHAALFSIPLSSL